MAAPIRTLNKMCPEGHLFPEDPDKVSSVPDTTPGKELPHRVIGYWFCRRCNSNFCLYNDNPALFGWTKIDLCIPCAFPSPSSAPISYKGYYGVRCNYCKRWVTTPEKEVVVSYQKIKFN
jgi:hypothetical protein